MSVSLFRPNCFAICDCILFPSIKHTHLGIQIKRTTYQACKITNKFLVTEINYLFAPASTPSVLSVTWQQQKAAVTCIYMQFKFQTFWDLCFGLTMKQFECGCIVLSAEVCWLLTFSVSGARPWTRMVMFGASGRSWRLHCVFSVMNWAICSGQLHRDTIATGR